MADINATITPVLGPGGVPFVIQHYGGFKEVLATILIPASSEYARADQIRFRHPDSGDCEKILGTRFIKQILFSGSIPIPGVGGGRAEGEWHADTQRLELRISGNNGTNSLNEAEFPDATALGAGVQSAQCSIFF